MMDVINRMLRDVQRHSNAQENEDSAVLLTELQPVITDKIIFHTLFFAAYCHVKSLLFLISSVLIVGFFYSENDEWFNPTMDAIPLILPNSALSSSVLAIDEKKPMMAGSYSHAGTNTGISDVPSSMSTPVSLNRYTNGLSEEIQVPIHLSQAPPAKKLLNTTDEPKPPKPLRLTPTPSSSVGSLKVVPVNSSVSSPKPQKNNHQITHSPSVTLPNLQKRQLVLSPQEQSHNRYVQARWLLKQGKSHAAIKALSLSLEADAANILARETWVSILFNQQRHQEAIELLDQGRMITPRHVKFSQWLARIFVEQADYDKALIILESAVLHAEQDADYLAFIATVYQTKTQLREAAIYFRKALVLRPKAGRWWMGLGLVYETEKSWSQAKNAYDRALQTQQLSAQLTEYTLQQIKHVKSFI